MIKSEPYFTIIYLLNIVFVACLPGCIDPPPEDPHRLYVRIRNCADDNLRIERGATNLHIRPNAACSQLLAEPLGFIDKNETNKQYTVSRSSGMCRKLTITASTQELKDCEDNAGEVPKPLPYPHVIITESDIDQSVEETHSLEVKWVTVENPPRCTISSFRGTLEPCP